MGLEQLKRSLDEKLKANSCRQSGTIKQNKKPLMERFRRRKINNYLEELKYLVLSALNKEVSLYNKMEKADILDMAVKFIKAMRNTTELSTTSCRHGHEQSTSLIRSYGATSPTPLQDRSENINHNNSCPASKNITQSGSTNEYRSNIENTNVHTNILCQDVNGEANEHLPCSNKENSDITSSRNEENMKSNTTRTSAMSATAIWRPW